MRILLGMSGGLDSAYAVRLLTEAGYRVEGAVLCMHDHTDLAGAQRCADEAGIPLHVVDCRERFREREGHYPSRILADKIYRNRENLSYCKEHGIRLSGPALGRPRNGETRDKTQDYRDECERVEVERRFSLAKRKCGMGLVTAKLRETAAHVIAMSILVLNLRRIQCALLCLLAGLLVIFWPQKKLAVVQ